MRNFAWRWRMPAERKQATSKSVRFSMQNHSRACWGTLNSYQSWSTTDSSKCHRIAPDLSQCKERRQKVYAELKSNSWDLKGLLRLQHKSGQLDSQGGNIWLMQQQAWRRNQQTSLRRKLNWQTKLILWDKETCSKKGSGWHRCVTCCEPTARQPPIKSQEESRKGHWNHARPCKE